MMLHLELFKIIIHDGLSKRASISSSVLALSNYKCVCVCGMRQSIVTCNVHGKSKMNLINKQHITMTAAHPSDVQIEIFMTSLPIMLHVLQTSSMSVISSWVEIFSGMSSLVG